MDAASIFLFCLMSLVIGAVLMLLIQYYAFVRYFHLPEESEEQKIINEKYSLPDNILGNTKSCDSERKYPIVALNLIMQFLFHELKNCNKVRKWFYRKLSLELDELITKTTTGKLFDKLTICDLDLGRQFPEIRNLRIHSVELHDTEGHIENLDLLLDLQYKGNFRLSIDADMVLGKKGSLTLRVKNLSGLARLQFTRKPYTHWSLSFLGDPQLDLAIESHFQGRQMQSNVTSLILNQIRKAVRRKHTLPNYKLRYKPFFHKIEEEVDSEMVPNGKLIVKVCQLSRLMIPAHITHIYCTLTLGPLAWVEARQRDDRNIVISIDLEIHKAKNQQIGIVFRQNDTAVSVEAVLPNTPAVKADLRSGDTLVSIEGRRVTTINQVAKIVKNLNRPVFSFRIERICEGIICNDAIVEDLELFEDLSDMNICFSKSTESVQLVASNLKPQRKESLERNTSSESSVSNTPSNSPRKNQLNFSVKNNDTCTTNCSTFSGSPTLFKLSSDSDINQAKDTQQTLDSKVNITNFIEQYQQHSTIDCSVNSLIRMDDECTFKLHENSIYLNLCVYGRWNGDSNLLGYLNVPINSILVECGETNLGHYLKSFSLMPPDTPDMQNHPLSTQSGFNPFLCYGDVLLSFVWGGSATVLTNEIIKKPKPLRSTVENKPEDLENIEILATKCHNFIRTHFHRTTQCDFCGKKIWLKDAVQCRDCSMCCHKKCVTKCQNSTVCGPVDCTALQSTPSHTTQPQPEFKVTEAPDNNIVDFQDVDEPAVRADGHRQSFSDLLTQGLKRVNSVNNLAIPGIVPSLGQSSRSLPPSPQHSPRKLSLVNQSTNPFGNITQKLEAITNNAHEISKEQIEGLTDTIIGWSNMDDIMSLAKTASKSLYAEFDPNERVEKINVLLSKLRIALDAETASHATLLNNDLSVVKMTSEVITHPETVAKGETKRSSIDSIPLLQTTATPALGRKLSRERSEHEAARKAILISQSEERVQALSVIVLYLCTGLQHAQGVACQ